MSESKPSESDSKPSESDSKPPESESKPSESSTPRDIFIAHSSTDRFFKDSIEKALSDARNTKIEGLTNIVLTVDKGEDLTEEQLKILSHQQSSIKLIIISKKGSYLDPNLDVRLATELAMTLQKRFGEGLNLMGEGQDRQQDPSSVLEDSTHSSAQPPYKAIPMSNLETLDLIRKLSDSLETKKGETVSYTASESSRSSQSILEKDLYSVAENIQTTHISIAEHQAVAKQLREDSRALFAEFSEVTD